jgi:hypothetical protein
VRERREPDSAHPRRGTWHAPCSYCCMKIRNIDWRAKLRPLYRFATKLPPVVRSLAGLALIAAGFLGIVMPILGFWMAPLGVLFISADVPPLRRRVEAWLERGGDEPSTPEPSTSGRPRAATTDGRVGKPRAADLGKPRRAAR